MALRLLVWSVLICIVAANSRVRRIVGGERAQLPPSPDENIPFSTPEPDDTNPLVFVKTNKRRAEVVGNRNPDGTYSFLGIRYAFPPTKNRRFVRPLRMKPKGLIVANKFGPPCPQWWRGRLVGEEDCLHLNIFTPQLPEGNNSSTPLLPVMMWIHGGNFKTGSAAQYVPLRELLRQGIVVVTVQYRLGTLGFLKFGNQGLGGNSGMFDISLASRWIREYINFFGGNPGRITVAGQGSGASSVTHLSFHRYFGRHIRGIISMSGGPVSPFALDENASRSGGEAVKANTCTGRGNVATVRCLQALPFENIVREDGSIEEAIKKGQKNVGKKLASLFLSGPTVEGPDDNRFLPNFIVETPLDAVSHHHIPSIPLLVGVTKQETGSGVKGNLLQDITNLLTGTFLTQGIFKDLLTANTGLYVNNTVNPSLSKLFDSSQYLKFFDTLIGNALSGIEKVIQHTTDALFNLPAFILCNFWAQKNKNVYLYSFEHTPSKSIADYFLNGITLVSNMSSQQGNSKGPSHGDDLAFLFDVRNIDGEPLNNVDNMLSEADKKVRDYFVTVVAEFVKTGKPRSDGANNWTPFNTEEGSYMIIKDNPKFNKGFRKCNMGLWTGDANILKSAECGLKGASEIVTNTIGSAGTGLLKATNDVTSGLTKTVGSLGNFGSGLVGGLYKEPSPKNGNNKTPDPVQEQGGLLGGLYKDPPPRNGNKTPTPVQEPPKNNNNKNPLGLKIPSLTNPFG
ncbi:esterase E4 [Halyomorpha halys]|uniref:esterase E4 n=1 Tax=Halyomorpha halys TaxID=286706 RepID=UPI0006D4F0E8|nr:esterase E4 [Halyomorpha halys]